MISAVGVLLIVVFLGVFASVFGSVFLGFWRMRGMSHKILTLAEQELERKLRDGVSMPTSATTHVANDPTVCMHCGSRVTAKVAQCPNCGAGLS